MIHPHIFLVTKQLHPVSFLHPTEAAGAEEVFLFAQVSLLGCVVSALDGEWPEVEKAEKLARGAALKWASGVFYQPDQLQSLGHYRIREIQRNSSIESRIKVCVVGKYLSEHQH